MSESTTPPVEHKYYLAITAPWGERMEEVRSQAPFESIADDWQKKFTSGTPLVFDSEGQRTVILPGPGMALTVLTEEKFNEMRYAALRRAQAEAQRTSPVIMPGMR